MHFFQYDEGLEPAVCDLLNTKLEQVCSGFAAQVVASQKAVDNAQSLVKKYKVLAPKTFKLAELSLTEIFQSLAAIHDNSFEIFNTMLACFPQNYFIGVIEDSFGAFFDDDTEVKLNQRIDRMQRDLQ